MQKYAWNRRGSIGGHLNARESALRAREGSPRGQPKRAAQESNPRGLCTLEAIDSCSHSQDESAGEAIRRGTQEEPGGPRRSQEELGDPGGNRGSEEETGDARRSQEEPRGATGT